MKTILSARVIPICFVGVFLILGCSINDNPTKDDDCAVFNWVYTRCDCEYTEEGCAELISTSFEELSRLQNLLDASGEDCLYVENIRGISRTISGYLKDPLSTACLDFDWEWGN